MREGDLTPLLSIGRGSMVAILTSIRPQGVAEFSVVKTEVQQAVKKEKALALSRQRIAAVASLDLPAMAKALGVEMTKDQQVKYLAASGALGGGASLHNALFAASPGQKLAPMEAPGGWVVIEVKKVDHLGMTMYAQQKAEIAQSLRQSLATQLMSVLIEAEKAKTEIKINPAYLKQSI